MKVQDIAFIVVLIVLLIFRNPRIFAGTGFFMLIISFILYTQWILFTAQRLVMYAACCFLLSTFFFLLRKSKVQ